MNNFPGVIKGTQSAKSLLDGQKIHNINIISKPNDKHKRKKKSSVVEIVSKHISVFFSK